MPLAIAELYQFAVPVNQLWQTGFTCLKVSGWGCFYLCTVLDDISRYSVAWKSCTTMKASDVFLADDNHLRRHESTGNLPPAGVWVSRGQAILPERQRIKRNTIKTRPRQ